jgi:ABC-type transport system involved in cytochrome c biogenesis permease subunit
LIDRFQQWVKPLASLKLTVVLMALAMVLIFAGTWAQIDLGIWTVLSKYFRVWWVFVPFQIFLPRHWNVSGGFPFPGGYIIGGGLLINLFAAHIVRFKVRATGKRLLGGLGVVAIWGLLTWWMIDQDHWNTLFNRGGTALLLAMGALYYVPLIVGAVLMFDKRCGIMLIHVSLILLLVGELVTAMYAHEANMSISEGQTVSYTENIHEMELAVIDHADPENDHITVIPESKLKTGQIIADAQLPFEIHIDDYLFNSTTLGPFQVQSSDQPDRKPRATRGISAEKQIVFEELPPISGVASGTIDAATAIITLYDKGQSLGTWAVSLLPIGLQPVAIGNKIYHISLRFKRDYKPYSMHLIDFRFDRYLGTNTPRNYSSQVQLIDPSRNEDREVLIYMNNPLRYHGETFFQSSFDGDTEKTTVLQVVSNPGWLLPYYACTIGAFGMLIHFSMQLMQFLKRRKSLAIPGRQITAWPGLIAIAGAIVIGLIAVPIMTVIAQNNTSNAIQRFGQLPVVDQGRIKPLDTLARISLMTISTKQTWRTDGTDGSTDPDDIEKPRRASAAEWMLDVMARPEQARGYKIFRIDHPEVLALLGQQPEQRKYFSFDELMEHRDNIEEQMTKARQVKATDRSLFQRKMSQLSRNLGAYLSIESFGGLFIIPPANTGGEWLRLGDAHKAATANELDDPLVETYINMLHAWNKQKDGDFAAATTSLKQQIGERGASETNSLYRARFESLFNKIQPFYKGTVLYIAAFILTIFSWLKNGGRKPLGITVFSFILIALILQTFGLTARIYIQDRPPVTNLYSSAVFIGWGAVILGLAIECFYRNTIGSITAAVIGFLTLIVAHNLSLDGDTMTMMQAVLDTNFWLATHVVVITLGYAATFLAGFLGIVYIFGGIFSTALTDQMRKDITRITYGILAFAILFSFVGTILGGIWADQSWGRFWGWDPKENGALLIVLWNALVLHARWGGLIKQRGLAVLAVAGNIVTCWSWFGTNMLGVGLHSYGFMDKALLWLLIFIALQLMIMSLGLLPLNKWRSLKV